MAETIFGKFSPASYNVVGMPDNFQTPTSNQEYPLGARFWLPGSDCVFRYAYAGGTALVAGTMVKSASVPCEVNKAVAAAAAIGDEVVYVTTAAAQAYLEGGMMIVNDVDGEGTSYPIRYSVANADTATSTDVYLALPLTAALTTNSQVELYASPYYDLDISAAITDHISGVPRMAVTANYYFWLQTWGPAALLVGGTIAAGDMVAPHTTDGSGQPAQAYTSNIVGFALTAGTATEYNAVYLRIAP